MDERRDDGTQIDADARRFASKPLTGLILELFYDVYNELGYGFAESVYAKAMKVALGMRGLHGELEWPIEVFFRGVPVGRFRADLLVEKLIILELKAAREVNPDHEAQVLHYLRATDKEIGFLLNFGVKPEFKRFAFANGRKNWRRADLR